MEAPLLEEAVAGVTSTPRSKLPKRIVGCYSLGHVLNDLAAGTWFSYLIFFLKTVRHLPSSDAGAVMLAGQVADAVGTVGVGLLSDKSTKGCAGLGRRKLWYVCGTAVVVVCFTLVFSVELLPQGSDDRMQTMYYIVFASLFNIGWAAVQVQHMSLIPELTNAQKEQVTLNSARYAASVVANVSVFLLLGVWSFLGPEEKYTGLGVSVVVLGMISSAVFLWGTPEPKITDSHVRPEQTFDGEPSTPLKMSWKLWLRDPCLWVVTVIYTGARLSVNVSQVYAPFFLKDTLHLPDYSVVVVPLLMYLGSLAASLVVGKIKASQKHRFGLGSAVTIIACALMFLLSTAGDSSPIVAIYCAAALMGFGNALQMVISGSLGAEMVTARPPGGVAFVFGAMSFGDKMSNGLAVFFIESAQDLIVEHGKGGEFVRLVFCLLPACASALACASFLLLPRSMLHPHTSSSEEPLLRP